MEKLEGRFSDMIKLPSGKVFFPGTFAYLLRDMKGIRQYRIIQEETDKFTIYLVKGDDFDLSIPKQIKDRIKKAIQEDIHVETYIVDSMPSGPSWKYRFIISKVGS